jgi:hypothetical protein
MAVQRGRSERRPEAYPLGYVEDLSDARTKLTDFFSILLGLFLGLLYGRHKDIGRLRTGD